MSYLTLVDEFHRAFSYRQPTPELPALSCRATNALRPTLMREELHELTAALSDNNRIEILDALCDLQYVTSGAVLAWGMKSLFESNRRGVRSEMIRDQNGHLAAMLGLITQMEEYANADLPMSLCEALVKFQERLDTCVVVFGFADVFSDAFAEVHRSNMSKLWDTPDYRAEGVYQMDAAPKGKWIARRADGKIIKSPTYSPADLSRFV